MGKGSFSESFCFLQEGNHMAGCPKGHLGEEIQLTRVTSPHARQPLTVDCTLSGMPVLFALEEALAFSLAEVNLGYLHALLFSCCAFFLWVRS